MDIHMLFHGNTDMDINTTLCHSTASGQHRLWPIWPQRPVQATHINIVSDGSMASWQHRLWASALSLAAASLVDTNMALSGSPGHSHRLWTSTLFLTAAWPIDIIIISAGGSDHGEHQRGPAFSRTMDLDMSLAGVWVGKDSVFFKWLAPRSLTYSSDGLKILKPKFPRMVCLSSPPQECRNVG